MRDQREKQQAAGEQLAGIGRDILALTRNELYLSMRFLDVALSGFSYVMDLTAEPAATDGFAIYYHPGRIGGLYRESRVDMCRLYLHMVLHCLFRHLVRRDGRDRRLWDLACDIAAESITDSMYIRTVRRGKSWLRQETYRKLREEMKVLAAEKIYGCLERWDLPERRLGELEREFFTDSHKYWPEDDDRDRKQEIENRWKDQSERTQTELETFSKEASSAAGDLLDQVKVENRERYNYREFLRKFAVLKEEVSVDQDSFDYVFYSYGLSLYGNMPLIEPQEWKETKKIEEFVIVVDTSMSCSGELVKKFLEETYGVLSEQDSFFHRVNIHIIQCDAEVQEDRKITSQKDFDNYLDTMQLHGFGGTDFRPVFQYVDELIQAGEFTNLKGMIYFTDGRGIFPEKKPDYDAAFVFLDDGYDPPDVPVWAIKLVLQSEEI